MAVKTKKINRGQISTLSAIIGKCAIKSVGSALFLPLIKLKAACTANTTETQDLFKKIMEEVGIKQEEGLKITFEMRKSLAEKEERLLEDEVSNFPETRLLSIDQFSAFHEENDKLTASELEFLYQWLVKP